jgi:hypothetical protein
MGNKTPRFYYATLNTYSNDSRGNKFHLGTNKSKNSFVLCKLIDLQSKLSEDSDAEYVALVSAHKRKSKKIKVRSIFSKDAIQIDKNGLVMSQ